MTDAGRDVVRPLVLAAWGAFLDAAEACDLSASTRLPGWRAQEVCTHLGVWPDYHALDGLIASARAGGGGPLPDVDAANAGVTKRHHDASRPDVLGALRRHRDAVAAYLDGPEDLDRAPTAGPVGRLPLLSIILGEAYELAVHALDLVDTGAPSPPEHVLRDALAPLADVTGGLAASTGVRGGATLHTPSGGWCFTAGSGGWEVTEVTGRRPSGPAVSGEAAVLLEASAGRSNPVLQLARRRLRLHDIPGLLTLTPVVEATPNLPGGPLLRLAARSLTGAAGLLRRHA